MAGEISTLQLADKIVRDIGRRSVGYVYISGAIADTDQIGIAGRLYEFDNNAAITGDVLVDVSGGLGAANAITQLVAAINGDASATVRAIDIGGDVAALYALNTTTNAALTNPVDAGGVIFVSAANMVGNAAYTVKSIINGSYTITAQDVTTLAPGAANGEIPVAAIDTTSTPTLLAFELRTSVGVFKSKATVGARLAQQGANQWLLIIDEAGGAAVMAATDVLTFIIAV